MIRNNKITGNVKSNSLVGRVLTKMLGLDFIWDGTRLGVKKENQDEYVYSDLVGPQGPQGIPGQTGQPGVNGRDGTDGRDGVDGRTPIEGVDYFTDEEIAEIQTPITEQYDSTKTYAVGDYCIYENTLYRCTGATTGNWDLTKWTESQITNELEKYKVPQGGVAGQILAKKTNADNDVEWIYNDGGITGDTLPVGSIVPFGSDTVPTNWLLCDGQAVSRTTYDLLFNIIGTTYGAGDGSTTFNLPNLKGKVAVGKDSTQTEFDNLGETGGEKTHTLTVDEMPSHNHSVPIDSFYNTDKQTNYDNGGGHISNITQGTNYLTNNRGGGQPHNILQPYQVTNYIIKAYQSAGIVATVVDGLNSTSTTDALSANQGRVLNEKATRKVATAVLSHEVTMQSGTIPLDLIENTTTNKLTLSNNGIRIGAGISQIIVSANVFANAQNETGYTWTYIKRNNGNVSIALTNNRGFFASTSHSPRLLDVQEGDIITIYKQDDEQSTIRTYANTYLTVEVVE